MDVVKTLRGCKWMYFGMSVSPPYLQATGCSSRTIRDVKNRALAKLS
jgi:hypothetical protein